MSIPCFCSTFSLNTSEKNPRESTRRTGVISLMSAISVTATCMLASSPQRIQIRLHKSLEKEKDADGMGVSNPAEIYPRPHDLANCHGCAPHQATANRRLPRSCRADPQQDVILPHTRPSAVAGCAQPR